MYHISAEFEYRTIVYKRTSGGQISNNQADQLTRLYFRYGKTFPIPDELRNTIFAIYYYEDSFVEQVSAQNRNEAVSIFIDNLNTDSTYSIQENYYRTDIIHIKSIKTINDEDIKKSKPDIKKVKMRECTYLNYSFIPEDQTNLKNEGFCVFDNFLSNYKHVTEEKFINLCKEISPVIKSEGITPFDFSINDFTASLSVIKYI